MFYSRRNRIRCNWARLVVAIIFPVTALCQTAEKPLDFENADIETVRLSPSRFPQLSPAIRQELARRGCTIPQVWGEKTPHNVIKGSFITPDELDWAVLCSVKRTSAILVFRNGSSNRVIELAPQADIHRLQTEGSEQIGYSREISPAGREFIMRHYDAYGGVKPPPIDHQGINDAFVGKASVVLYFYRGKWVALTGED